MQRAWANEPDDRPTFQDHAGRKREYPKSRPYNVTPLGFIGFRDTSPYITHLGFIGFRDGSPYVSHLGCSV